MKPYTPSKYLACGELYGHSRGRAKKCNQPRAFKKAARQDGKRSMTETIKEFFVDIL